MLNLLKDYLKGPKASRPRGNLLLRKMIDSGGTVTFSELFDLLWGHREDGGPIDPENILAIEMHYLRKELKPGVRIRGHYGQGYSLEISQQFAEKALLQGVASKLGIKTK